MINKHISGKAFCLEIYTLKVEGKVKRVENGKTRSGEQVFFFISHFKSTFIYIHMFT